MPVAALEAPMNRRYSLLLCDQGTQAEELGRRLMSVGHSVYLSDSDADLEVVAEAVDAIIDVRVQHGCARGVLCTLASDRAPHRDALHTEAEFTLPLDSDGFEVLAAHIQSLTER
jgi:hypothetical protein